MIRAIVLRVCWWRSERSLRRIVRELGATLGDHLRVCWCCGALGAARVSCAHCYAPPKARPEP